MLSPLVMATLLLFLLGAAAGLLLQKLPALANRLNSGFALLGSLAGLVAAIQTFAQGAPVDGQLWLLGSVHLDMLSALMLLVISTVGVAVALYSFAYIREYQGKGDVAIGALMNLFLFAMVGMVLADNAFGFLLCYELVTLTTYWLVKTNPEAAKQSRLYLVMNHIGMALVLIAFWLLCRESGSLEFAALREHHLAGALASLVFLLSFCGFGLRAGFVPLHGWLPVAEPVAPSHISALMSGVMVKLGLFGILRVSIDFLGASQLWWGYVVLIFGVCSAVLGVLFALAEHDLKRLLAYHTVENIGIILMGMGIGMIGIANQQPALVVLGLLGALYHLLNHAIFKSLLFMGTGSVMFRLHTRDMDKMGGAGQTDALDRAGVPHRSHGHLGAAAAQRLCQRVVYLPVAPFHGQARHLCRRAARGGDAGGDRRHGGDVFRQGVRHLLLRRPAQRTREPRPRSAGCHGGRHPAAGRGLSGAGSGRPLDCPPYRQLWSGTRCQPDECRHRRHPAATRQLTSDPLPARYRHHPAGSVPHPAAGTGHLQRAQAGSSSRRHPVGLWLRL